MRMMPNFLIIGAPKSGTTALYSYIKQHPQVFMSPVKEPQFFAFEGEELNFQGPKVQINSSITDLESYQALFQGVKDEKAIGEASALYLGIPKAPERIDHYLPDVKMIAILRHPVDRAYASFMHLIRDGREPLTNFADALEAEEKRIAENWGFLWRYKQLGFYSAQLERYFKRFPREQMRVYLYDDFCERPLEIIQDIFQFLDIDRNFIPDLSVKPNVSGRPRFKFIQNFIRKPNPIKNVIKPLLPQQRKEYLTSQLANWNLNKPKLSLEFKAELTEQFQEDITHLQHLINRDLSHWLTER